MTKEKNNPEKFKEALSELGESTVRNVCTWLNQESPRKDGRVWVSDMVILGDYAIDEDKNNVSGIQNTPRFLLKTTSKKERPARFRLIN